MPIRWLRILIAAVVAEVAAIVFLVVLVAIFGPGEAAVAQAFAERQGAWAGLLGGYVAQRRSHKSGSNA